jgi:hypothetical protein
MTVMIMTILKNLMGYIGARLLKPEVLVELILDLLEKGAERSDTPWDDKILDDVRTALGHKE